MFFIKDCLLTKIDSSFLNLSRISLGICQKGSNCKYVHDKEKIRICPSFLSDRCTIRNCLLSHSPNDNNTPVCRYYLENKCNNPQCKYRHFKPPFYDDPHYEIWTCRPFIIGGWCPRGKRCPFLHALNCPDFEEYGYCNRGRDCTLFHPVNLRTQDLMTTRTNKYVRSDTVVSQDEDPNKKIIISSYTVDPDVLFTKDETGNYQFYIDNTMEATKYKEEIDPNEFLIHLSSSEEESDFSDDDELEHNDDYVNI